MEHSFFDGGSLMEKKRKKIGKKWIWIVAAVMILAGGAEFLFLRQRAMNAQTFTNYSTQAVSTGSITGTVGATGNVYARQSVQLNWKTSGIVSKVYVTKGQKVAKDTLLAELEQSSLPQEVINAAIDLAAAQKDLEDLMNSNTARAKAELALIQAEQALEDAQKEAESMLYKRASDQTIDIARANLIQAEAALEKAADIYNLNKSRSSDDVQYAAALSSYAKAQQTYNSAKMNLEYVQSLPDPLSVQQANAELALAEAQYQDASRAWERIKDGPTDEDLAAARAKVTAAQAVLDQAFITAPISGTVVAIETLPGDLVTAGTYAVKIVDLSHLYIDISVSEVDINLVKLGQPVEIVFDAISDKTFNGVVTDIAMEGASSGGTVNFNVTAEITDPDARILPGMTATANIVVTQKDDVVMVPSSAIRTLNNQQVVYVLRNNSILSVVVEIGDTDAEGTSSEVLSGDIAVGDLIVLNPPSANNESETAGLGLLGRLFGGRVMNGEPRGVMPQGGDFQPPAGGNGDDVQVP
jgi:HlyD family secretion protein